MIHFCGNYKSIPVYQDAEMIGNNYYGSFYCKRVKNGRKYKVKESSCKTIDDIKKYIDTHLDSLLK